MTIGLGVLPAVSDGRKANEEPNATETLESHSLFHTLPPCRVIVMLADTNEAKIPLQREKVKVGTIATTPR